MSKQTATQYSLGAIITVLAIIAALAFGYPRYKVWKKQMDGKAAFAEAEQNRKILIEEARARLEAEKLNAEAEIERAKGMAQAMQIENGQLSEVYNQYLFIRSLSDLASKGDLPQIIYLPTEGMLPVMDVSERQK